MPFSLFSMNTLFRVLYTVVIQWRTYMMVCGPEGGWGCFSLINREMVRNPDKLSHSVNYINNQDCTWMTGLILLTALDSLFFCALTSILRSPLIQQVTRMILKLSMMQIHLRSHKSPGRNSKSLQKKCFHLFISCHGRFLQLFQYLRLYQ